MFATLTRACRGRGFGAGMGEGRGVSQDKLKSPSWEGSPSWDPGISGLRTKLRSVAKLDWGLYAERSLPAGRGHQNSRL